MAKAVIFFLFPLYIFSQDLDFDGVEDEFDRCLNSNFSSIVGKDGCKIKSLEREWSFGITYENRFYDEIFYNFSSLNFSYQNIYTGVSIYRDEINYLLSYGYLWQKTIFTIATETAFKGEFSFSVDATKIFPNNISVFGGYIYSSFNDYHIDYISTKSETIFGGITKSIGKSSFSTTYSNNTSLDRNDENIQYQSFSYSFNLANITLLFSVTKNIDKIDIFYSSSISFNY